MFSLNGHVAIIFGATGLIGSEIAKTLADCGAKVVIHYHHNKDKAKALVNDIKASGGMAMSHKADIRKLRDVKDLVHKTLSTFSNLHIAISTVHPSSQPNPVHEMTWSDWTPHIDAIKGHFNICKSVLPDLRKRQYGRIVFISGGLSRRYFPGFSAYSTVKAGLNSFCKTLALEEGENNITANIVAPGKVTPNYPDLLELHKEDMDELVGVSTRQIPLRRFANVGDVAKAVLYFSSPEASGITGQTLFVAGGEIMP